MVEFEQIRVRQRVRLEAESAVSVELEEVVPVQEGRLAAVPGERRRAVGDGGRDEDGGTEAVVREHRERVLGVVQVAVVEAQCNRPLHRFSRFEQLRRRHHVDDAVALGIEVRHLLAEAARPDGQLVRLVGDAVVEEDAKPVRVEPRRREHVPESRARMGCTGLERVEGGLGGAGHRLIRV